MGSAASQVDRSIQDPVAADVWTQERPIGRSADPNQQNIQPKMIENKKPKGKILIVVGSVMLMLAILLILFLNIFLGSLYYFSMYRPIAFLTALVLLSASIITLVKAGKQRSGKLLLIIGIVSLVYMLFQLSLYVLPEPNRFLNSVLFIPYSASLMHKIAPFFAAIGCALILIGAILNMRSPALMPAPTPRQQQIVTVIGANGQPQLAYMTGDAPNGGFAVLGFFFPLIGLILYLMWKDQTPLKAKSCGKGALIGVIVNVGITLILTVVIVVLGVVAS